MIKVSDYITEFLIRNNIHDIFTITGGFSMHLNDSFGKRSELDIYYQHHEQACGYSAVGYSKVNARPCVVCTTAGCAATNTISPCLVAHQDSVPVLFLSGQVKVAESIRNLNHEHMKLRHYSGADSDIISMVEPITKFAYEITSVSEVKSVLIQAFTHLLNGRPGPVWLSIPVDIQGMMMDISEFPIITISPSLDDTDIQLLSTMTDMLKIAKRPVIIAGNGIKLGHAVDKFHDFLQKYPIPVVVSFHGTDIIESDHPLFCGKIGIIGDRTGNFVVQNADLVISMGCRMAQGIIGYRPDWFAREAKIIYIDNDINELNKENLTYDLRLCMDLKSFYDQINTLSGSDGNDLIYSRPVWIDKCQYWKKKWLLEMPPNLFDDSAGINPYHSLRMFFTMAPNNKIIISSSGSIITNVWHMNRVKSGDKFILSSQGDMGFELPAAIGAAIAEKNKIVIPILGEGSLQLNLQELQTIVQYQLPIKILVFNNGTHGATKMTQTNFFKNLFGVNAATGISFPDTEKICFAYGIKYRGIRRNGDLEGGLADFLSYPGAIICEIFSCIQSRYPRLNAICNEDGTFSNRPLEDMDPFMSREEFSQEMIVDKV